MTAFPHLLPQVQEIMERSDDERIRYARTERWYKAPAALRIEQMLDDLLDAPPKPRMESLLIVGETGAGKTTILRHFQDRAHPPYQDGDGKTVTPVHIVGEYTSADVGDFWSRVIKSFGEEVRFSHRPIVKEERALEIITEKRCRMLIIDELHNMFPGPPRKQRELLVTIKALSNLLSIPIVAAGTEEAARTIRADPQLAERFLRVDIPLWKMDGAFIGLLGQIEKFLPLKKPSHLKSDEAIRERVLKMSAGTIANIVSILKTAAIDAIRRGEEQITPAQLDRIAETRKTARDPLYPA